MVDGTWPTVRFEFSAPAGWNRSNLDSAAERVAIAACATWWELAPLRTGRWTLLLDASDSTGSPPPSAWRTEGTLSIPLGCHPDGPGVWDLARAPHLIVAGATGSGKSSLLRNVVASVPLGWCWRVVVIDPKELDFAPARYEIEVAGLAEAPNVLSTLADQLAARKQRLSAEGCDHWRSVPECIVPVRPVLVVVDEAADLLAGVGLTKPETQVVRDAVGIIARQGRACGFHLVTAFTRPDTDAVPGAIRDQFAARVALGPLSQDGAKMVFGSQRVPALPEIAPGSGLSLGLDGGQRLRRLRSPWVTIDDVRKRHGLPVVGPTS